MRAPLETLFDFFANANNLKKISPSRFRLEIEDADVPLRLGSRIRLRMQVGLFAVRWELSIRSLKRGDRFIEWQERGPFREWRHTHLFERSADGTRVVDMVEYEMAYGFLGSIMHRLWIRTAIEEYFHHRQARLVELFGEARESGRGHDSLRGRRGGRRTPATERESRVAERESRGAEREPRGGERRAPAAPGGPRRRGDGERTERPSRGGRGERERGERERGDRERGDRGEEERGGRGRGRAREEKGDRSDRSLARAAGRILERERLERLRDLEGADADEAGVIPSGIEFEIEEDAPRRAEGEGEAAEQPMGERRRRRRRGGRKRRGGGAEAGGEPRGEASPAPFDDEVAPDRPARGRAELVEANESGDEPERHEERRGRGGRESEREGGRRGRGGRGRDRHRDGGGERRGRREGSSRGGDGHEGREDAPAREAPTFVTIYPPRPPREIEESAGGAAPPDLHELIIPEARPRSAWGRSPHRSAVRKPEPPKEDSPAISTPPSPPPTESGDPPGS